MATSGNLVPYLLGNPFGTSGNSNNNTDLTDYKIQPYGDVDFSASARNPLGYLICTGEVYSQSLYPDLYLAIGNQYSAQSNTGSKSFNSTYDFVIPNLMNQGTFVTASAIIQSGASSNFTNDVLTGGASSVSLTPANIASHKHDTTIVGNGLGSASGAISTSAPPTSGTSLTTGVIYNNAGTSVTNAGSNGSAFSIINPYNSLNAIIRATYTIPSTYQLGKVNFTNSNNQFYMIGAFGSLPTPTVYAMNSTLPVGSFTVPQTMSNIVIAMSNTLVAYGYNPYTASLLNYNVNSVGNWVCKINLSALTGTGTFGSFVSYAGIDFSGLITGVNYSTATNVPNATLDATATMLGFFTRQPGTTSNAGTWNTNIHNADYVYSPKPMNIYWGSIADGTITSSQFPNTSNSF